MADLPVIMTSTGPQSTPPATLRANLVSGVGATNPGYTANLPGALIEDISSTQIAGLAQIDQIRVDLINSISPFGANLFLLLQLGNIYLGNGSPNPATNTTVQVIFSGTIGFVIAQGFTVSDGSFQYIVQSGGIVGSNGSSLSLTAVAVQGGSWPVPIGTVNQLITSLPVGVILTVTNLQAGTPGASSETESDYRSRILQAGLASATGMGRFLKAQLQQVTGVQARLVSTRQVTSGYEVIVGGAADQYQVAYAIWQSLFDITTLQPSSILVTGITRSIAAPAIPTLTPNTTGGFIPTETVWVVYTYLAATGETQSSPAQSAAVTGPNGQVVCTSPIAETGAINYNIFASNQNLASTWVLQNPSPIAIGTNFNIDSVVTATSVAPTINTTGIVTTSITHQYVTGSSVTITGATPTVYNGTFTITVFTPTTFSTEVDTSADAVWTSGGVCTPNSRNVSVTINDYPDTYVIPFVVPPQQTVTITVTWNTSATNFVGAAAVAQLAQAALVTYINSIGAGQPILVYQLEQTFQQAVASLLPSYLLTRMIFAVALDGAGVAATSGTGIIPTDPESFLYTTTADVVVTQG